MGSLLGLIELVLRATDDDLFSVRDKLNEDLFQVEDAGLSVDESEKYNAVADLKLRLLVKLIQNDLSVRIFFSSISTRMP